MPTREPQYYIRIFKDDDWFVLWRIAKEPKTRVYKPIWRRQETLGQDEPHLYKTLAGARNTLDVLNPVGAVMSTVAVWKGSNADV